MTKHLMSIMLLGSMVAGMANAQPTHRRRKVVPTPPQQTEVPKQATTGESCLQGAVKAAGAAAIVTGFGCFVDLFVTGGTLCMTYVTAAAANAPTAVAAGCALGALGNHGDGASAGIAAAPHIQLEP